jgi:hypothetical protein
VLDQRGQLLRAAVGFAECSMPSCDRALHGLRSWLDSWSGIGHVAVRMARQDFTVSLGEHGVGRWIAIIHGRSGLEPIASRGHGAGADAGRAVHRGISGP